MELSQFGSGFGNFGGFGQTVQPAPTSWLDVLGTGIGAIGNILTARTMARAQPSYMGQPIYGATGGIAGPLGQVLIGAGSSVLGGMLGGGGGAGIIQSSTPGIFAGGPMDYFRPDFYTATRGGYRAKPVVAVSGPSGQMTFYRNAGQFLIGTNDGAIRKRIDKSIRRLGFGGGRFGARKSVRRRRR